jgi:prepilin signal peptidase PulO-like enzyme (type II secretory pathway)
MMHISNINKHMKNSPHKKKILLTVLKYIFALSLVFSLIIPKVTVYALGPDTGGSNTPNTGGSNTGVKVSTGITNPLGSGINDLPTFITTILKYVLFIGVPIIVLAIIYSGFQFVIAQGNAEALKKAKMTLLYTLIGAAILLGSFVIANAIKSTVTEINNSQ